MSDTPIKVTTVDPHDYDHMTEFVLASAARQIARELAAAQAALLRDADGAVVTQEAYNRLVERVETAERKLDAIRRRIFGDRADQNLNEDPEMAVAHLVQMLEAAKAARNEADRRRAKAEEAERAAVAAKERAEAERDEARKALREIMDTAPIELEWLFAHKEERDRWSKAAGVDP